MAQKAMVINMHNCVGCGACGIACKAENNTQLSKDETSYNWADFHVVTKGTFPEVKYTNYPVLCNHCSDAPCVEACPLEDKAIFKTEDGLTMTNNDRCIGCQSCVVACPYSSRNVKEDRVQYSILSFNKPDETPHSFYESSIPFIVNGSSNPKEVAQLVQIKPPYANEYTHEDYKYLRRSGVVEKCIFCEHRTKNGEQPYCVEACPTNARIFGDIDDPESEVSKLIVEYETKTFKNNKGEFNAKNEKGTRPNVYYIRDKKDVATSIVEEKQVKPLFKVYPNPASTNLTIEVVLETSQTISIVLFDISGRIAKKIVNNKHTPAGNHKFNTGLGDLQPGAYICSVQFKSVSQTQTIIVNR